MIASADLDGDKEEATGQSLRVVVIDDEPVIAHTLEMILRESLNKSVFHSVVG
jgi:hypothetical protein